MSGNLGPRRGGAPALSLVDALYLTPWIFGIIFLRDLHGLTVTFLIPIFVASWWQDWRSARAADTYFSGYLTGFDALTAANYATLAISWKESPQSGMLLNSATFFHWTGIFVIYIVWNLALVRGADQRTRAMFIGFSLAELPLVVAGGLLTATAILHHPPSQPVVLAGISFLTAGHVALLVVWRIMSRGESD